MAKPRVDVEALFSLLRPLYPDITTIRPMSEGEESRVFQFVAEEASYVVRINPSADGFEMDRLAFEQFNGPDLPIPEVTHVAPYGAGNWLCVSRRIQGETLQALPPGGALAYGAEIGRVIDAMAGLTPRAAAGAGPFSVDGQGQFATWPNFIGDIVNWDWPTLAAAQRTSVADAVAAIEGLADNLPDIRRVVHGDFGSNNILVAGGRVVGVIDWSEVMIGDPDYDIANLLFWRPWLDCMEQQCRYFELYEPHRLADDAKLNCYQLHIGLKVLHDALTEGDQDLIGWTLARCKALAVTF